MTPITDEADVLISEGGMPQNRPSPAIVEITGKWKNCKDDLDSLSLSLETPTHSVRPDLATMSGVDTRGI